MQSCLVFGGPQMSALRPTVTQDSQGIYSQTLAKSLKNCAPTVTRLIALQQSFSKAAFQDHCVHLLQTKTCLCSFRLIHLLVYFYGSNES
jgi:hypothetical protein